MTLWDPDCHFFMLFDKSFCTGCLFCKRFGGSFSESHCEWCSRCNVLIAQSKDSRFNWWSWREIRLQLWEEKHHFSGYRARREEQTGVFSDYENGCEMNAMAMSARSSMFVLIGHFNPILFLAPQMHLQLAKFPMGALFGMPLPVLTMTGTPRRLRSLILLSFERNTVEQAIWGGTTGKNTMPTFLGRPREILK